MKPTSVALAIFAKTMASFKKQEFQAAKDLNEAQLNQIAQAVPNKVKAQWKLERQRGKKRR